MDRKFIFFISILLVANILFASRSYFFEEESNLVSEKGDVKAFLIQGNVFYFYKGDLKWFQKVGSNKELYLIEDLDKDSLPELVVNKIILSSKDGSSLTNIIFMNGRYSVCGKYYYGQLNNAFPVKLYLYNGTLLEKDSSVFDCVSGTLIRKKDDKVIIAGKVFDYYDIYNKKGNYAYFIDDSSMLNAVNVKTGESKLIEEGDLFCADKSYTIDKSTVYDGDQPILKKVKDSLCYNDKLYILKKEGNVLKVYEGNKFLYDAEYNKGAVLLGKYIYYGENDIPYVFDGNKKYYMPNTYRFVGDKYFTMLDVYPFDFYSIDDKGRVELPADIKVINVLSINKDEFYIFGKNSKDELELYYFKKSSSNLKKISKDKIDPKNVCKSFVILKDNKGYYALRKKDSFVAKKYLDDNEILGCMFYRDEYMVKEGSSYYFRSLDKKKKKIDLKGDLSLDLFFLYQYLNNGVINVYDKDLDLIDTTNVSFFRGADSQQYFVLNINGKYYYKGKYDISSFFSGPNNTAPKIGICKDGSICFFKEMFINGQSKYVLSDSEGNKKYFPYFIDNSLYYRGYFINPYVNGGTAVFNKKDFFFFYAKPNIIDGEIYFKDKKIPNKSSFPVIIEKSGEILRIFSNYPIDYAVNHGSPYSLLKSVKAKKEYLIFKSSFKKVYDFSNNINLKNYLLLVLHKDFYDFYKAYDEPNFSKYSTQGFLVFLLFVFDLFIIAFVIFVRMRR